MIEKIKHKISALNLPVLYLATTITGVFLIIHLTVLIYDNILLGVFLGNETSLIDGAINLFMVMLSAYLLLLFAKAISAKKK